MLPRDLQCLERICEYCESIENAITRFGNSFESFEADTAYHDLICFYFLQIGELAGHLSSDLRAASAGRMEWGQIRGMRNIVAHHYGSIKLDIVWNTAVVDIPALKAYCTEQLNEAEMR